MFRFPASFTITLTAFMSIATCQPRADDPTAPPIPNQLILLDGQAIRLEPAKSGAIFIIEFFSPECPISNAYTPVIKDILATFPADKVIWIALCPDDEITDDALRDHAREFGLAKTVGRDPGGRLARSLQVSVTPEVVVVDHTRAVRYQGRIDDRWVARGKRRDAALSHDLRDALDALSAGKPVPNPRTEPVGCPLPTPRNEKKPQHPEK